MPCVVCNYKINRTGKVGFGGGKEVQFTLTTDYAIRAVLSLKEKGQIKRAGDIAEEMKIPPAYLNKILKKLRTNGFVGSTAGINGGHYLLKGLDEITLYDIVLIMEPTVKCNRCLEPDEYCSRFATDYCSVRQYFTVLQDELENKWLSITLQEIVSQEWGDPKQRKCRSDAFAEPGEILRFPEMIISKKVDPQL